MPVDLAVVTDAQVALARSLTSQLRPSDDELRAALAAQTCPVPRRDPTTSEVMLTGWGAALTDDTVDPYGVAAGLWELEGIRLAGADETPLVVTSESNGDESRSYSGGGPRTSQAAFALARRLYRRSLCGLPTGGSATVQLRAPGGVRGYGSGDLSNAEVVYTEGLPVPTGAAYQLNRPEPRT